jgi:hypothetical protein
VSSVDQAMIDLVERVSMWEVPGLKLVSFVHEVHTFDRQRKAPSCADNCVKKNNFS